MKVPFFRMPDDVATGDLIGAAARVIESRWYVLGQELARWERTFAAYCGVEHCVGVASGTDALELALRALDVRAGDEVALCGNAGFYGSTAVQLIGAVPVFVDVAPANLTLSVDALRQALARHELKAVVVTHLYGQLVDIEAVVELARSADVPVVEDCAQAHGASRNGRRAGSFGAVGCFSFYPTKNLGALGDAGALVTEDAALAARVKQLRQYGWAAKYHVEARGGRNSRLDEIQAALLSEKLPALDFWNAERRAIATRYNEAFGRLPLTCPRSLGDDYVAHLYVIRTPERDALQSFLIARGIAVDIHFPVPDHLQAAYRSAEPELNLPVTEEACRTVLSLPCFPGLSESEQTMVISTVEDFFAGGRA